VFIKFQNIAQPPINHISLQNRLEIAVFVFYSINSLTASNSFIGWPYKATKIPRSFRQSLVKVINPKTEHIAGKKKRKAGVLARQSKPLREFFIS